MDGMIVGMVGIALLLVVGGIAVGGFVVLYVGPLLTDVRRLVVETQRLVERVNGDLPALVRQTTQTLKNLDGTLVENLPTLVARTSGTLEALDGSLATELPGLIRETTKSVRKLNDAARPAGA